MDDNTIVNDTIIAIRNVVLEQLKSSKDLNMEYKLCVDFLKNHKNDKYRELMISKTGKDMTELLKYSQQMVMSVSNWLYDKINSLTEYQRSDIMNDPIKMDALLEETHKYIGGMTHDRPIFSYKSN